MSEEGTDVNIGFDPMDFEDNPAQEHVFFFPKYMRGKYAGRHMVHRTDGTVRVMCSKQQLGDVGRVLITFAARMVPFEPFHPGYVAPANSEVKVTKDK